jgi:tetratricopeptide (TPR) repeat protein
VAAESIEEAASRPAEALKLAQLSQRIAELVSGPEPWRRRLQGYAGVHVSNAYRVSNDVPFADTVFARAKRLWEDGAAGDPGLLNGAIVLGIEATLRDAQRRFPEALRRIDEALGIDPGDLKGRLLLAKAQILEALGDLKASTAVLRMAAPLIDRKREPRTAFGLEFQLHANLCLAGRAAEAEPTLPRVRALGEHLGKELDLVKVMWVEAKVAAGVGRLAGAEAAFLQVKKEVTERGLAYDAALVSLDLALLFLEQGRMPEVKQLAESMAWIFAAQGVEREKLVALRLFCEAAREEAASIELAKRVVRYLHRAQHDPELKFEGNRRAEAP